MIEPLISFGLLLAFVGVAVAYARHANSRDRYEASLYDMPVWWLKEKGFSRRRA